MSLKIMAKDYRPYKFAVEKTHTILFSIILTEIYEHLITIKLKTSGTSVKNLKIEILS